MTSIFDRWKRRKLGAPVPQTPPAPPASSFDTLYARALRDAERGDREAAIRGYQEASAADPARAEAYYKRGNAQKDLGRLEEAVASYDAAIARDADYAYAYCNRGSVLHQLGRPTAALESFDRAIALDPGDALAHYNRALVLQDLHRLDEALASYDEALRLAPDYADAHYNRALLALFCGDFTRGWPGYEWRWRHARRLRIGEARSFSEPLWRGDVSLSGKRLLLYAEAGIGDTLQFCRYVACCAARGGEVVLEVQAPLVELLRRLPGVHETIATGGNLPPFDYQCALLSLPLAFNTTLDSIPAPARYLAADPALISEWRTRLGAARRPRIGLVWSGNPGNSLDARRSVRLAEWLPHLPPQFDYFRLQTEVRAADRTALESSGKISSFDDRHLDFSSTAALCECLDLVLSVDTSLAHLGGALGRKTWVLLPLVPDWRWLRERSDSPWYPSMRLFRQPAAGDWTSVFESVARALHQEFDAR
jgi:tetratricopeptide (TPR) repeat protein